jgi:sugar phosphate isomerase/epimerase
VDTVAAPGSIDERDYQASFDRVADLWREAARLAQDAGVRMVWEFEPGFAFNKPSEILSMHQQVAHPNFRLLFDTSHAYMCGVVGARQHGPRERILGGVPDFLRKLRGRIGAIHLIDSDGTLHGDETSTHRPFGEGFIDFGALAPLLLEVPDIEWWCIDMCFWAGSWELVESSLAYVRNLVRGKVVAGLTGAASCRWRRAAPLPFRSSNPRASCTWQSTRWRTPGSPPSISTPTCSARGAPARRRV